jgi:hypothetical protein
MYIMHGINYTGHCSVPRANFPGVLGFMEKITKRDFYGVFNCIITTKGWLVL